MKVSIIIPSWNNLALLKKSIPNVLREAEREANKVAEVIVVDDASTDGSWGYLKSKKDKIRLIRHRQNRGFSASVNTGARSARSDLLCFLNVDVVPKKDFLKPAIGHFKNKSVFAVSLAEDEHSWARGYFRYGYVQFEEGEKRGEPADTLWVSGGSGVFRRNIWMELHGMDEELFSPFYWEDIDIGYRASKRGYRLIWEPQARVTHKHGSTINESNFPQKKLELIKERNELLFNWKNLTSTSMLRKHIRGMLRRALRNPGYLRVIFMALLKLKIILKRRKVEKKESKFSDESVLARFDQ